jgi:phosphoribosylaminoimidazole-succinocarboxamide synthase
VNINYPTDVELSRLLHGAPLAPALERASLPGREPTRRGKVREVFAVDDERLLIVASDRLSAFDVVFPTPIPAKGRVLTALSAFWFRELAGVVPNHFLALPDAVELAVWSDDTKPLAGRAMLARRTMPLPLECVVRGRLEGSGWREYRERGAILEHAIPAGLALHDELPTPIFTPATKAESGHDENITFVGAAGIVGADLAARVRDVSLALFAAARDRLAPAGIELADTKFEFGIAPDGELLLIDEALTPDSSRFLLFDAEAPSGFVSMDKQFVRDWAGQSGWNMQPPAPPLPADVVEATADRYLDIAFRILATAPAVDIAAAAADTP